jgi:hypothetical protein
VRSGEMHLCQGAAGRRDMKRTTDLAVHGVRALLPSGERGKNEADKNQEGYRNV